MQILVKNPGCETQKGIELLSQITKSITELEPSVSGMDRSNQYKVRTICSQNTQVNNELLSLAGGVEELLECMGFTKRELGNKQLKPNWEFKHNSPEWFSSIEYCLKAF